MVGSANAYVADFHEWTLKCSEDGYELTSKYPVSRTTGYGAGTQVITEIEKLYLGKSCDAPHKVLGKGTWCWANGGFKATFDDHEIGFGRQELWCESGQEPQSDCGC